MKFFLYSPISAIVKLDQEVFSIGKNPIMLDGEPNFIEYLFGSNYESSYAATNTSIVQNMRIIDLYGGLLYFPKLQKSRKLGYKLLFRQSFSLYGSELLVTVFSDGGTKLRLETTTDSIIEELPFEPKEVCLEKHKSLPYFIISLKASRILVKAFYCDLSEKLSRICDSYALDDRLILTTHYGDILSHTVETEYSFTDEAKMCVKSEIIPTVEQIPYAFLEEVGLCGDYQRFLSDELKERAPLIKDFFGDYICFFPPIESAYPDTLALIYESEAKYVKFVIDKGLIQEITLENYPIK